MSKTNKATIRMITYSELSRADWESIALIITENGHGEDIEIDFVELDDKTAEIRIRIKPELQLSE